MRALLLRLLLVPPEPEPPAGSPESIRIFRASPNFYYWNLATWALGQLPLLAIVIAVLIAGAKIPPKAPEWVRVSFPLLQGFLFTFYLVQLIATFLKQKLDYELRWYVVTDRSLRIRSGIFWVREMTMTFANVQHVSVAQGPLQRVLGIATVEVSSAGGGSVAPQAEGGHGTRNRHAAEFDGVDNAQEIRDLILARVRQYRDAGLGDPDDEHHAFENQTRHDDRLAALEVLEAARQLSQAVGRG